MFICSTNDTAYLALNEGVKFCEIFSKTTLLQSQSHSSIVHQPFSLPLISACTFCDTCTTGSALQCIHSFMSLALVTFHEVVLFDAHKVVPPWGKKGHQPMLVSFQQTLLQLIANTLPSLFSCISNDPCIGMCTYTLHFLATFRYLIHGCLHSPLIFFSFMCGRVFVSASREILLFIAQMCIPVHNVFSLCNA